MKKANLFIVGSTKAGTTSIHNYISAHENIFMSKQKEPHYFCYKDTWSEFCGPGDKEICKKMVIDSQTDYEQLFSSATTERYIGESTASYLHIPGTAEKIYNYNPEAKIIISLRNPVKRTISAYNHLIRDGRESENLEKALELEEQRLNAGWMPFWGYTKQSFYYENVLEYINTFGKENVLILLYEKEFHDVEKLLIKIQRFLNLPELKLECNYIENSSGKPKSKFFHSLLREPPEIIRTIYQIIPKDIRKKAKSKMNSFNMGQSEKINSETMSYLFKLYKKDVERLEEIIPNIKQIWGYK